jgi:hypothetical protein
MKYFSFFPTLRYGFHGDKVRTMMNIFSRPDINIKDDSGYNVKGNKYVIDDAKSPDSVSRQIYETPELFWSILATNNIIDIYKQWPISSYEYKQELLKTNGNFTFYTIYNMDIRKHDIVVKSSGSSSLFDNNNFGVVLETDKFLRSFDVLMLSGDIKKNDSYYILRPSGINYTIVQPVSGISTQILKKKTNKLDGAVKFSKLDDNSKQRVAISPYYSITNGSQVSEQIQDLSSGDGVNTILYRYMSDSLPINHFAITYMNVKDEEWLINKTINVIPNKYRANIGNAYTSALESMSS